jgi:hypothetical protein
MVRTFRMIITFLLHVVDIVVTAVAVVAVHAR